VKDRIAMNMIERPRQRRAETRRHRRRVDLREHRCWTGDRLRY
jgi:hypothetical protein